MRAVNLCGLVALFPCLVARGIGGVVAVIGPILLAVTMAGTASILSPTRGAREGETWHRVAGWWVYVASTCASIVLVLVLASAASASLALLWLGTLVVTSPHVRRAARGRLAGGPAGGAAVPMAPEGLERIDPGAAHPPREPLGLDWSSTVAESSSPVSTMSTAELCHLWRTTFWMVRDGSSPGRTACVVALRQAALDELDRRHPEAIRQWLRSGHHCADGPARYL
jgi:hypothetical protein